MRRFLSRSKVFLGGTCNQDPWRDHIIPLLSVDFFNPVVEGAWGVEAQQKEVLEKNTCTTHLYVITPNHKGWFTPFEVMMSAGHEILTGDSKDRKKVILAFYRVKDFPSAKQEAIEQIIEFFSIQNTIQVISTDDLEVIADTVNRD